jgi:hypothetical protein
MPFSDELRSSRFGDGIHKIFGWNRGERTTLPWEDSGNEIHKICLQILRDLGGDLRGGVRGWPARPNTAKENTGRKKGVGVAAVYALHGVALLSVELPYIA